MSGLMRRALVAEWTKLRSVRSTTWIAIAVVAATIGVTAFLAAVGRTNANEVGAPGDDDVVVNSLRGAWLGQVAVVALGAVAATSEFATGTIRTTFAAIPRRRVAFGAKATVVGAAALLVGSVASVVSFLVAQPLLHEGGFTPPANPYVSLADGFALRATLGTAVYLALLAMFAMGVATIARHTAAAMTVAVGLVLVPTVVLGFFTGSIQELIRFAPAAGLSIQVTRERWDTQPSFGPWAGLGVTAAWAAAALIVGAWTSRRRDA